MKHALGVLERILGYYGSEQKRRQTGMRRRQKFQRLPLKKGLYLIKASRAFLEEWRRTRPLSKKACEVAALRDRCQQILCAKSQRQALDLLAASR